MKDLLAASPAIIIILAFVFLVFATVFMPIFVMVISSRLKASNDLLKRIDGHLAAANRQPARPR